MNNTITIVGTGYVGLVTGACLASSNRVICVDKDSAKIAALQRGMVPIYEPGLQELLERNKSRLMFTTNLAAALVESDVVFIAVSTPTAANGAADTTAVLEVATAIGQHMSDRTIIVDKSTVPVGTAERVYHAVRAHTQYACAVLSNPEFLAEGRAITDFTRPDRIVIGALHAGDAWAIERLRALYKPFVRDVEQILVMDARSAELVKYAANAMLATRISFMNEIAELCDHVGVDIDSVRRGIGSDHRIGPEFLYAGVPWGGSCFEKDTAALRIAALDHDVELGVVVAARGANNRQLSRLFEKVTDAFTKGNELHCEGKRITVWGLAFKPRTDDIRESAATDLITALLPVGLSVTAHDPVVTTAPEGCTLATNPYCALEGSDGLVLMTEWPEYKTPDWPQIRRIMRTPNVFDFRNSWNPAELTELGFHYVGVGRGRVGAAAF